MQLDILYHDEHLLAVHKPAGLLVHRSWIDPHETRFALQMARDLIGRHVYPVHRLDKPTSGLLLFALDSETAAKLSQQFQEGEVRKHYAALVRGYSDEQGFIDHALSYRPDKLDDRRARADKPPQPAQTSYRRLATVELPHRVDRYPSSRYSLLEVSPLTGRKHQIRRHMKHIAHPLIGDPKFGKSRHNRLFAEHYGCPRLLLAATAMELAHPVSGDWLELRAPLQDDYYRLVRELGWDEAIPAGWRPPNGGA